MTEEELKQEAEKSLDKRLGTYAYIRKQDCYTNYVDGYIDSAEPREKRITELEQKLETERSSRIALVNKIADLEAQIEKMRQCGNCGNGTIGNCEYCKRKPNQTRTDTSDYWRLKEIKRK